MIDLFGLGSSPRVWGQVDCEFNPKQKIGIIPTRVGTSTDVQSALKEYRDHPHACGDKVNNLFIFCHFKGSSPRVWGQERP